MHEVLHGQGKRSKITHCLAKCCGFLIECALAEEITTCHKQICKYQYVTIEPKALLINTAHFKFLPTLPADENLLLTKHVYSCKHNRETHCRFVTRCNFLAVDWVWSCMMFLSMVHGTWVKYEAICKAMGKVWSGLHLHFQFTFIINIVFVY